MNGCVHPWLMITALIRAPHLYHVFPRNYILYYYKCLQANTYSCACNCPPFWQFCGLLRSYQPFQIFVNLHCVTYLKRQLVCLFKVTEYSHMILLFAWTSSPEYYAGLHCDIWQVHVHLSVFGLAWKALNREKGHLLPTWARKRTCQSFVWSIQSKRWQVIFRAQVGNR